METDIAGEPRSETAPRTAEVINSKKTGRNSRNRCDRKLDKQNSTHGGFSPRRAHVPSTISQPTGLAITQAGTIIHMEVPCCTGLVRIAEAAVQRSGRNVPLKDVTISIRGQVSGTESLPVG